MEPHGQIRSYVLRQGRLTDAQRRALDELWEVYGLDLPAAQPNKKTNADETLDYQQAFGRNAPLHLELGFGDGDALLQMAEQNPDCNFIGVEVHRPGVGRLLLKLKDRQLTNVRVFCDDGISVLRFGIAPNTLDAFCLYFPDPWPKKKHHKRRIMQPVFIELVADRLRSDGSFQFATDWQSYAEEVLHNLDQSEELENCAGAGKFWTDPPMRPCTKFERRGHKLGHSVWDVVMKKLR